MANVVYNVGKEAFARGYLGDLNSTTYLYAQLHTSSYTPNADHTYAQLTNEVANGNGYTTGGAQLASVAVTKDETNDWAKVDATDPQWTSATFTARYCVVYFNSTSDYPLVCLDFGSDVTATNGTFTVQFGTNGIFTIS